MEEQRTSESAAGRVITREATGRRSDSSSKSSTAVGELGDSAGLAGLVGLTGLAGLAGVVRPESGAISVVVPHPWKLPVVGGKERVRAGPSPS